MAAGSEREPHGELRPPRRGARQEQIGGVGAGDQQHEADHGQQNEQRPGKLPAQSSTLPSPE